jgi:hypothetical protein
MACRPCIPIRPYAINTVRIARDSIARFHLAFELWQAFLATTLRYLPNLPPAAMVATTTSSGAATPCFPILPYAISNFVANPDFPSAFFHLFESTSTAVVFA